MDHVLFVMFWLGVGIVALVAAVVGVRAHARRAGEPSAPASSPVTGDDAWVS